MRIALEGKTAWITGAEAVLDGPLQLHWQKQVRELRYRDAGVNLLKKL
jgi:hypothetical protein